MVTLQLPLTPFELTSPVLGLLLVFRTNNSYLRLAEANLGLQNYRQAEEFLTKANWALLKAGGMRALLVHRMRERAAEGAHGGTPFAPRRGLRPMAARGSEVVDVCFVLDLTGSMGQWIDACKTHIAYGSPNKIDSSKAHGSPLGPDEIALVKEGMGWDLDPFTVPDEVYELFAEGMQRGKNANAAWKARYDAADTAARPRRFDGRVVPVGPGGAFTLVYTRSVDLLVTGSVEDYPPQVLSDMRPSVASAHRRSDARLRPRSWHAPGGSRRRRSLPVSGLAAGAPRETGCQ